MRKGTHTDCATLTRGGLSEDIEIDSGPTEVLMDVAEWGEGYLLRLTFEFEIR